MINYFFIDKPLHIINVINIIKTKDYKLSSNFLFLINNFKSCDIFFLNLNSNNKYFNKIEIINDFFEINILHDKVNLFLTRIYAPSTKLHFSKLSHIEKKINKIFLYDEGLGSYLNKYEINDYIPHKKFPRIKLIINFIRKLVFYFTFIFYIFGFNKLFHFRYYYNLKFYKFGYKKFYGFFLYKPEIFNFKNPKDFKYSLKFKENFLDIFNKNNYLFRCFEDDSYLSIKKILNKRVIFILPDWYLNLEKIIEIINNNLGKNDFVFFKSHTHNKIESSIPNILNSKIDFLINSSIPAELVIFDLIKNNNFVKVFHDNSAIYFNYSENKIKNLEFINYGYLNSSFEEVKNALHC